jgi:spore germination cell wall hydrolase CwlJ-like protein
MLNSKLTGIFTSINLLIASFLLFTVMLAYSFPHYVAKEITQEVRIEMTKEMDCLAKNIYYEAGSELYEGKLAVAQVTLNRVNSGKFPSDICSVVYQKTVDQNMKTICQFSWTCMVKELVVRNKYQWEESQLIAKRALTQPVLHDTIAESNALFFHAVYVNPGWNKTKVVKQIGNHIFYSKI